MVQYAMRQLAPEIEIQPVGSQINSLARQGYSYSELAKGMRLPSTGKTSTEN